ncbi:hypothetical protein N7540_002800 [Penicillium herquei]|nr:hypothetical protein N7540_002800 [Penicillium herquei]
MVIATDSEYVVKGITTWIGGWIHRDWRTRNGGLVKNRDLWECLLREIKLADEKGLDIQFWRIPREWNTDADRYAKIAAAEVMRCVTLPSTVACLSELSLLRDYLFLWGEGPG